MTSFLITHGERFFGPNPVHKQEGIEQIKDLQIPADISLVVIGTGARFKEIYEVIKPHVDGVPVKYSPFCGSADGLEADYNVILVDGTLVDLKNDYTSLGAPCFDAWKFVSDLPDRTLLCAGGELLIALGLKAINEKGQLYELDPETATGKKIS